MKRETIQKRLDTTIRDIYALEEIAILARAPGTNSYALYRILTFCEVELPKAKKRKERYEKLLTAEQVTP